MSVQKKKKMAVIQRLVNVKWTLGESFAGTGTGCWLHNLLYSLLQL
jgi:hypothetical protein